MDYGNVVYDQPSNNAFSNKLETFQYNAALAIMGAIKATSHEKLYQQFGLKYFQQRIWMRHLCLFYKVVSTKLYIQHIQHIRYMLYMLLFLQQENLRDIQTHLTHSLAELSI